MLSGWIELLSQPGVVVREGISSPRLEAAETQLGVSLPLTLRDLYQASDGAFDGPGQWYPIWPLDRVISDNLASWKMATGLPPTLIGFGDNGAGSWFCMRLDGTPEVLVWHFIDGEGLPLAATFAVFWTGWYSGQITT